MEAFFGLLLVKVMHFASHQSIDSFEEWKARRAGWQVSIVKEENPIMLKSFFLGGGES